MIIICIKRFLVTDSIEVSGEYKFYLLCSKLNAKKRVAKPPFFLQQQTIYPSAP